MAFYDEIGRKISKTSQEAVQKTRDYAEAARLNSEISEREHKISNAYTEIGRIYCQKYSESITDEDILLYLQEIVDNMQKIEEIQMRIQVIRGIKKCKNCGADVDINAMYCNQCGEKQMADVKIPQNTRRCPECGEEIGKEQMFCTNCGRKVDFPTQEEEQKLCKNCGAELSRDTKFCVQCGTKITEDIDVMNSNYCEEIQIPEARNVESGRPCPGCGEWVAEEQLFCTKCGRKVDILTSKYI